MVLYEQAHAGFVAARKLGSQDIHRDHQGDPGEEAPVVGTSAARQRAALEYACQVVFDDTSWNLSPDLIAHLAAGRWSHWGSSDDSPDTTFAIHGQILAVQRWTLDQLLSETTLRRVEDAPLKVGAGEDVVT